MWKRFSTALKPVYPSQADRYFLKFLCKIQSQKFARLNGICGTNWQTSGSNRICFKRFNLFYQGKREDEAIPLSDDDEVLAFLKRLWTEETDVSNIAFHVLGFEKVWGQNLNDVSGLTDKTAEYLRDMKQTGMRKALKKMMNSQMAELGDM